MLLNLDPYQKEILESEGNIVVCSGRQVGKSTIISIKASEYAMKYSKKQVLVVSVTERQAEELLLKILYYLDETNPKIIKKGKDRPTKSTIRLTNGSVIRSLPTGKTGMGIRGYTIDLLICDEAGFMGQEIFSVITPMLLVTGGSIILISTPHVKEGYFWDCYSKPDKMGFKVFHINSLETLKNRPITSTWSLFQRESAMKHIEAERERLTKSQFAMEYLGQFVDDVIQFFSDNIIKASMKDDNHRLQSHEISELRDYFLGVDIARMGKDESTFEIVELRGNKPRQTIIHRENLVTKNTRLTETADMIVELNKVWNFRKIYIDDGGLGAGVFDFLLKIPEIRKKIIPINNSSRSLDKDDDKKKKLMKEDLYTNLLRLMERGEIMLLPDDNLFLSLKCIKYEYTDYKGKYMLRIFGDPSHIVEGLVRACFCINDKINKLNIHYF